MASKSEVGNLAAKPHATLPAVAVVCSSFLSGKFIITGLVFAIPTSKFPYLGAMMSLSAFVIPVLLDTNPSPEHIVRQWVRLYHYGHIYLPALCIAACGIYSISAYQRARNAYKWRPYAYAALSTISMVPFTWVVMTSTNNTLFKLDELNSATDRPYVKALIVKWAWMHITRSFSPLVGSYIGFAYLLREQRV